MLFLAARIVTSVALILKGTGYVMKQSGVLLKILFNLKEINRMLKDNAYHYPKNKGNREEYLSDSFDWMESRIDDLSRMSRDMREKFIHYRLNCCIETLREEVKKNDAEKLSTNGS